MHEEEKHAVTPVGQLLNLYRKVMDNPNFDQYQIYEADITTLFEKISEMQLSEADLILLSEVRILHEQIIHVILEEKSSLNEEIDLFERKKRANDHYGKSSNYNVGAFFVDLKN
ncbi:hypothetical protein MKX50_22770 [Paenibacillus sp. FSL W8-0186]|uniref:Flagellar protein FliT n=1 Tax=Paenibacillus woosongensis TaxID=307580 RepID=A0ABQ4MWC5_9BACL|nr:hypothetical protein [Paenibacillus woosongensis]GIP60213.1 hypothetical protein J15TS10_40270 [Paenibacillus woosongensis]